MFKDAKVGDKVCDVATGWGIAEGNDYTAHFPLLVKFNNSIVRTYLYSGKEFDCDMNPSLFWDEVKIIPPPKPKRKVRKYQIATRYYGRSWCLSGHHYASVEEYRAVKCTEFLEYMIFEPSMIEVDE